MTLASELTTPLSEIKRMSLVEAADYLDSVRRRSAARAKAIEDATRH